MFLKVLGDILHAGIGKNLSVDIERWAFELAGFLFAFVGEFLVRADIARFKRDFQFLKKSHHGCRPRTTGLVINNDLHTARCHNFIQALSKVKHAGLMSG